MSQRPDADSAEPIRIDRLVAGGRGFGRFSSGEVALVSGVAPGDVVEIVRERGPLAAVGRLISASERRTVHPCEHAGAECGGCDLHFISNPVLIDQKLEIVADSLARLARINDVAPYAAGPLTQQGFRTSMRMAIVSGRAGFRQMASHDVTATPHCEIAHPLLRPLLDLDWGPQVNEVTFRAGANTNERLVIIVAEPDSNDERPLALPELPQDVVIDVADGSRALNTATSPHFHEQIAGRTFRVSSRSFFQSRPDGAAQLVELVLDRVGSGVNRRVVDMCCGVGLFAGCISDARPAWQITAVESARSSSTDAVVNLRDSGATVVRSEMERWRGHRCDVVVADPPRIGLRKSGASVLASTGAETIVLVSCDAASLGRDAGLLVGHGYKLTDVCLVDMFPHTHHVEVVSTFNK